MAKDAKGHGSEKRGGGGYNPVMQGGQRMFGRQPTASERGQLSQMTKAFSAFAGTMNKGGSADDAHAAATLAAGHPKSDASPVHPGAAGRSDYQRPLAVARHYANEHFHRDTKR